MAVSRWATLVSALGCCAALSACQADDEKASFYVIVPLTKAHVRLDQVLASLAKKHGLTPDLGQVMEGGGQTLYILQAKGRWMKLWAQNVTIGGDENPEVCGHYTEPHPDPGQYYVTAGPILPLMPSGGSRELASQLRNELTEQGYEVTQREVPLCSSLSRLDH
jgi:hypothetical protein